MRVRWTFPALNDLDEIQDHIALDSPAAAHRLIGAVIDRTEALLSGNSMAGRVGRVRGTRELVLSGLPYIIVYRVKTSVEIVAIVHGAREWPDEFQ